MMFKVMLSQACFLLAPKSSTRPLSNEPSSAWRNAVAPSLAATLQEWARKQSLNAEWGNEASALVLTAFLAPNRPLYVFDAENDRLYRT